jgi:hypothetical protein
LFSGDNRELISAIRISTTLLLKALHRRER